ncbi:hypothetical protein OCL06_14555 [Alteromonas sp. ASW11-19]|uniref:DUF3019 domain-containing protein n=1 Tax=Alteromonas salexigens TaxID=2982530 RepID=A0ABT2VTP2_9ALTE|nr:hypothetical protein [Alteromonas salexigens]MCU7555808.1 hypothetical protein [Alteromonas salexigens]
MKTFILLATLTLTSASLQAKGDETATLENCNAGDKLAMQINKKPRSTQLTMRVTQTATNNCTSTQVESTDRQEALLNRQLPGTLIATR